MRKLVYLGYIPLTESYKRYLCVDELLAKGVSLEYWDVTGCYFKELRVSGTVSNSYVRAFHSLGELESALSSEGGDIFLITVMAFEPRLLGLMRLLGKHNVLTGHMAVGLTPQPPATVTDLAHRVLRTLNPRNLINFIKYKGSDILRRSGWAKGYDYVFAAGSLAASLNAASATKIVPINSYDFDACLADQGGGEPPVAGKYCVFLDENLADHPDLRVLGLAPISPAPYYDALNSFFGALEKKYGLKVVIAAHPKSDYEKNLFGGRAVLKYMTRQLVRHAEFAFTVGSNSSSFCAVYGKPVFFIYTNEIVTKYAGIKYDLYPFICAEAFGSKAYDITGGGGDIEVPKADAGRLAAYKYAYMTAPSCEHRRNSDILYDFLTDLG